MNRPQAILEGVYVDFSASPGMISTIKPTPINHVYQPSKKEVAFDFARWVINSMMMAIMGDGLATIPKVIGIIWLIASRKSVINTGICIYYGAPFHMLILRSTNIRIPHHIHRALRL